MLPRTIFAGRGPLSSSSGTYLSSRLRANQAFFDPLNPTFSLQCRTLWGAPRPQSEQLYTLNVHSMHEGQVKRYYHKRMFLWSGLFLSLSLLSITGYQLYNALQRDHQRAREQAHVEAIKKARTHGVGSTFSSPPPAKPDGSDYKSGRAGGVQLDALPGSAIPVGSKVVIHNPDGPDLVPTGNSTVPHFPRTMSLPGPDPNGPEVEYRLIGLGMRTVTFLHFNVYIIGFYIATQDIAEVQQRLIKGVNPLASTLVPDEKATLRQRLDDPSCESEALIEEALFPARTAVRITPVRDTDFHHLRDGFIRAITHRRDPEMTKDKDFGDHIRKFKAAFNRGRCNQGSELLMQRDPRGKMTISFVDAKGSGKRLLLGEIDEPRISRLMWLNYLHGKVASPPARESIMQGIMDVVERPVGTVAAQVV